MKSSRYRSSASMSASLTESNTWLATKFSPTMRLSELKAREGSDIPNISETENSFPGISAANPGIPAAHPGIPAANFLRLFMDFMNNTLYMFKIILFMKSMNNSLLKSYS